MGEQRKPQGLTEEIRALRERVAGLERLLSRSRVDEVPVAVASSRESAAERAGLEEGYSIFYVEPERGLRERLLGRLLAAAADPNDLPPPHGLAAAIRTLHPVESELERLALWDDPRGLYAHCLCGEEWP